MPDTQPLVDQQGQVHDVPIADAAGALDRGWRAPTTVDSARLTTEAAHEQDYGGLAGGAKATLYGGARGASLGLSDVLFRAGGVRPDDLRGYAEQFPRLTTGSEIVGGLLPAFAAPESLLAKTPAGAVSTIGKTIVEATEGAGALARAGAATAGAAAEGALYGGGSYLSQVALGDKPLAAEGFLGAMGKGALWAAPVGGALSLGADTLTRAKALFPRSQMTRAAAREADQAATSALSTAVRDGDTMLEQARQRIARVEAQAGAAQSAENASRAMFGAADPATVQNQITHSVDTAQITEAVNDYTKAKAQLEDWIRAEADPDLERALLRIRTPNVQDANAPKLNVPEWGEIVPPQVKDPQLGAFTGDFDPITGVRRGADGTPGPHEPPRMSITTDLPPLPLDKTSLFDFRDAEITFNPKTKNYYPKDPEKALAEEAAKFAPHENVTGVHSRPDMPPVPEARTEARPIGSQKEFRELQDAFREKLTPDEIKHSLRYTREDYNDVNRFLRGDSRVPKLRPVDEPIIPALDAILEKGATTDTLVTHRAVHFDPGDAGASLKPGDVWTDPAYQSTSYRADNIGRFGNTHFVITSPPGTKIAPVPSAAGEGEFLLARNSKLRITSRSEEGGKVTYHATVEPGAAPAATDTLTGQMRSMQSQLGAGADLKAMGAPARADYAAAKAEKTKAAAEHFRAEAIAKRSTPLTTEEFGTFAAGQRSALSRDAKNAVDNYSGPGLYKRINDPLRENPNLTGDAALGLFEGQGSMREIVKGVDDAIASSAAPRDMTVFRGVRGKRSIDQMSALKPGDVFVDPGFGSTTFSREIGGGFAESHLGKGPLLEISVPKGHPALPVPGATSANMAADEAEILLPRGTRHVVTAVGEQDGRKIIKMVVNPADEAAGAAGVEKFTAGGTHLEMRTETTAIAPGKNRTTVTVTRKLADGEEVPAATAEFTHRAGELYPEHVTVEPALQRNGVASRIYQAAEKTTGKKIIASETQTADGKAFSGSRPGAPAEAGATDQFFSNLTRPKTRDAYVAQNIGRAMREEGSHAAALAKVEREWAESGGAPSGRMSEIAGHRSAPAQIAKEIVDRSVPIPPGLHVNDDAIAAALRKHNGKNVDIGSDLGRAAKAIGDVESALASLVDVLGPDAPATAIAHAKAFRAATAGQAETLASSAAKAAEDIATKVRAGIDTTVVDSDISKALRKAESKDSASAARAVESLGRQDAKAAARPTGAAEPGSRRRGALGIAADVGTALEVLNAMGVHVPDASSVPVIGPVLSMYLKARAVMGVLGRHGGSIGRTTESLVASKSAAIRDRVTAATQSLLTVGAAAARKAGPIAGPAGALAYKLFPGDGDTKSKDPRVFYEARMNEIARAQQPGAIEHAVADRIRTGDPDLQDAIVAQARKGIEFLASKAPREAMLPSMLPGDGKWHPSKAALEQWARYVAAVHDPAGVLEDLAKGHVTAESAETLRVVYPKLYAEAQRTLLEHAVEFQHTLKYSRRVTISIMYRIPVDGTMSAAHLQYIQGPPPAAAPPQGPAPSGGGAPALTAPLNIGQQTMTSVDRRAGV